MTITITGHHLITTHQSRTPYATDVTLHLYWTTLSGVQIMAEDGEEYFDGGTQTYTGILTVGQLTPYDYPQVPQAVLTFTPISIYAIPPEFIGAGDPVVFTLSMQERILAYLLPDPPAELNYMVTI